MDCFQVFRLADRGFFIVQDRNGQFVPKALKTRREKDESTARFSKTILRKCMDNAEALLIEDAAQNEQFQWQRASLISRFVPSWQRHCFLGWRSLWRVTGRYAGSCQEVQPGRFTVNHRGSQPGCGALDNVKLHENLNHRQKMQREIELAVEVQKCFLPNRLPVLRVISFFAYYKAAREVGGDFYGFLPLVDNAWHFQ